MADEETGAPVAPTYPFQGKRRPDGTKGHLLEPGEYALQPPPFSGWYAATPVGLLANLGKHDITVHDDGTITVEPSILVIRRPDERWHGYLRRGVWSLA